MHVRLQHYETGSTITLLDDKKHLGSITYTQVSHKSRSVGDFNSLKTEHRTYGDRAMKELFDYFLTARNQSWSQK